LGRLGNSGSGKHCGSPNGGGGAVGFAAVFISSSCS